MEEKENIVPDLISALGEENLKSLPVYFRLMEPMPSAGQSPIWVESKFHSTNCYVSIPFHKPVSKLPIAEDDSKK